MKILQKKIYNKLKKLQLKNIYINLINTGIIVIDVQFKGLKCHNIKIDIDKIWKYSLKERY